MFRFSFGDRQADFRAVGQFRAIRRVMNRPVQVIARWNEQSRIVRTEIGKRPSRHIACEADAHATYAIATVVSSRVSPRSPGRARRQLDAFTIGRREDRFPLAWRYFHSYFIALLVDPQKSVVRRI